MRFGSRLACLSLSTVAALLLGPAAAEAGVQRFTPWGPGAGTLRVLAADAHRPATIYAMGANDLYKSDDGGLSWVFAGTGRGSDADGISSLVSDPDHPGELWAAGGALHHSTDGGKSWTRVSWIPGREPRLALIPGARPAFLAVVEGRQLLQSVDAGESWQVVYELTEGGRLGPLVVDPRRPELVYLGDDNLSSGIAKSTDGGATWAPLEPAGLPGQLALAGATATSPVTLFAGRYDGLYVSRDDGATWRRTPFPVLPFNLHFAADPRDPARVYLSDEFVLFASADGGATWTRRMNGMSRASPNIVEIHVSAADGQVYLSTSEGIALRAAPGAPHWFAGSARGLLEPLYTQLWLHPTDDDTFYFRYFEQRVFGGAGYIDHLVRTRDGGRTWEPWAPELITTGGGLGDLAFDPTQHGRILATTLRGLYASADGGETWELLVSRDRLPATGKVVHLTGTTWLAAGCGLARSTDGGRSWTETYACFTLGPDRRDPDDDTTRLVTALSVDPFHPARVVAAITAMSGGEGRPNFDHFVVQSDDGGLSWRQVRGFLHSAPVYAPNRAGTAYRLEDGLRRTLDGGGTWTLLSHQLDGLGGVDLEVDPFDADVVYAATENGGLLRTVDGGRTWQPFSAGLADWSRQSLSDVIVHPRQPGWVYVLPVQGGVFGGKF